MSAQAAGEWTVDLVGRRVRHRSGAEAHFYRYHSEADWLQSDGVRCHNPYLFEQGQQEFARKAKEVAIKAGMKAG
jgi:hypothetical protein